MTGKSRSARWSEGEARVVRSAMRTLLLCERFATTEEASHAVQRSSKEHEREHEQQAPPASAPGMDCASTTILRLRGCAVV